MVVDAFYLLILVVTGQMCRSQYGQSGLKAFLAEVTKLQVASRSDVSLWQALSIESALSGEPESGVNWLKKIVKKAHKTGNSFSEVLLSIHRKLTQARFDNEKHIFVWQSFGQRMFVVSALACFAKTVLTPLLSFDLQQHNFHWQSLAVAYAVQVISLLLLRALLPFSDLWQNGPSHALKIYIELSIFDQTNEKENIPQNWLISKKNEWRYGIDLRRQRQLIMEDYLNRKNLSLVLKTEKLERFLPILEIVGFGIPVMLVFAPFVSNILL